MLINALLRPHFRAQMHKIHKQGDVKLAPSGQTRGWSRIRGGRNDPAGLLAATLHLVLKPQPVVAPGAGTIGAFRLRYR